MKITVKNKSEDCGASASSLGAIPTGGSKVRKNEGNGKEYNVYVGQYELIITDKILGEPYGFIDSVPLYDNLEDDLLVDYPSATIIYDQDIKDEVIANIYPWLDGDNTGSIQFADFSKDVAESKNESENPISKIYGDGKIVTHVNSADGSFANEYEPIGYAILNNDVEGLKALKNGNPKMPEEPNRTAGWYEEDVDDWRFDWDDAYDKEFREDWERVIGKKDNQEALKQMLEYDRGFIVASIDFDNAIHAGYDKAILKKLFDNIRKGVDDDEDLKINYLGDDDYINAENPDPIANIEKFLSE